MYRMFILSFILIQFNIFTSPCLTIITSVYKGDKYIEHFFEELTKQTIYPNCEHIIINAASPGNEEAIILKYQELYPNIVYHKLERDPGLYGVWNLAIKMASADFITNANLDDIFSYDAYEVLLREFEKNPSLDFAYSNSYTTNIPNQCFSNAIFDTIYIAPEFSVEEISHRCFLGSHPMWKKSIHQDIGYFDEYFKCMGDWEMWIRAGKSGKQFKHVNRILSLNYSGPETLTNRRSLIAQREKEWQYLNQKLNLGK